MKLEPEIINPEVKDKVPETTTEEQLKKLRTLVNKMYLDQRSSSSVGSEGSGTNE
ncbi:hypothetical protein PPK15_gp29 [Bacillus phage 000TH010]|uniref:Uncharacterized protein n=1 Tax=Bacillus phage 000TH010 TaxID=2601652 RepID=A0A5P8PHP1_9CAUD|nr:hypothetical protein PPK15_gp29 [Bacillus phage 000TH010]QFR56242.1 hypothetical protein 000TH010_29 [Bacillus phage 000TH010]